MAHRLRFCVLGLFLALLALACGRKAPASGIPDASVPSHALASPMPAVTSSPSLPFGLPPGFPWPPSAHKADAGSTLLRAPWRDAGAHAHTLGSSYPSSSSYPTLVYRPAGPADGPNVFTDFPTLMVARSQIQGGWTLVVDTPSFLGGGAPAVVPVGSGPWDLDQASVRGSQIGSELSFANGASISFQSIEFAGGVNVVGNSTGLPVFQTSVPSAYYYVRIEDNSGVSSSTSVPFFGNPAGSFLGIYLHAFANLGDNVHPAVAGDCGGSGTFVALTARSFVGGGALQAGSGSNCTYSYDPASASEGPQGSNWRVVLGNWAGAAASNYTPLTPSEWNPAPAVVSTALDQLAAKSSADFVLNPTGAAGGNVFTSWAALYSAASTMAGPVRVQLLGDATVPAGTYAVQDWTLSGGTGFTDTLTLADGVHFTTSNWSIESIIVNASATTSPPWTASAGENVLNVSNVAITANSSVPFIQAASGHDVSFDTMAGFCEFTGHLFDNSGSVSSFLVFQANWPLLNSHAVTASAGQTSVFAGGGGTNGFNTVVADTFFATGGSNTVVYDAAIQFAGAQTGFTMVPATLASGVSYSPAVSTNWNPTPPTVVSSALDDLAAKVGDSSSFLANTDLYLDISNASGHASDSNDCASPTTPCVHKAEIIRRWGKTSPRLPVSSLTFHFLSVDTDGTDPGIFNPIGINASGLTVIYTAPLPTPSFTGTLGTVTPKVTSSSPGNALQTTFATSAGAIAAEMLLVDSTHPSRAFVQRNVSGDTWQITQPMTPYPGTGQYSSTEVDTWASGDAITGYALIGVDLTDIGISTNYNGFTGTGITVWNMQLKDYTTFESDTVDVGNAFAQFVECEVDKSVVHRGATLLFDNSLVYGDFIPNSSGVFVIAGNYAPSKARGFGVQAGLFVLSTDTIVGLGPAGQVTIGSPFELEGQTGSGACLDGPVSYSGGASPSLAFNEAGAVLYCGGPFNAQSVVNYVAPATLLFRTTIQLNGVSTGYSLATSGGVVTMHGGIPLDGAHLDAAAGATGFGGYAFGGGATFTNGSQP